MAKIKLLCEHCGKECYKYPSQIKSHVFCSKECGNLFRRTLQTCVCEVCGKEYRKVNRTDAGRFCSKRCLESTKTYKICEYCGDTFYAKFSKNNPSKFCSMDCYNEARKADESTREGMWKWAREIYRKYDNKCAFCGSEENLCAHHILAFKYFPELRSDTSNGICYCQSCHSKVHKKFGYRNCKEKMLLQEGERE